MISSLITLWSEKTFDMISILLNLSRLDLWPKLIIPGEYSMWSLEESVFCFLWMFSSVHFSRSVVSDSLPPHEPQYQASLSITNSRSVPKPMSIVSVMPSSHLILCRPLLLLPPIPPSMSLFQWVSSSHQVAKVLEFQLQHQSLQWTPRTDLL